MQLEVPTKTKSLQGIGDLTLVAPIKPGLIEALDTRTYASRLRLLLKTLGAGRASVREYSAWRPFSDAVERVRTIHSFRLAILDAETPKPRLLLAVTFDSAWEPYIRKIWDELGPLLDVIFCNCDGYPLACESTHETYAAWVRKAQVGTEFFYNASSLTVDDLQYLRHAERLHRDTPASAAVDLATARIAVVDPRVAAKAIAADHGPDAISQGLSALASLYKLVDMYPPDRKDGDGDVLLRAAQQFLSEFDTPHLPAALRDRFAPQLAWFERPPKKRLTPPDAAPAVDLGDVQGGILSGYEASHAALLLMACDDAAAMRGLLDVLLPQISRENSAEPADGIRINVGFTLEGLRVAGLTSDELKTFPQEFREGMEARYGVLGDFRSNHPRAWALPERNWPAAGSVARVQMSMVHLVVQLSVRSEGCEGDHVLAGNPRHPLHAKVSALAVAHAGAHVLSVEAMRRNFDAVLKKAREHFGFIDGFGQPTLDPAQSGTQWPNVMPLSELLTGRPANADEPAALRALKANGSYLVVRKLRQDVPLFERFIETSAATTGLAPEALKAKLMGRTLDGDALADPEPPQNNDFTYAGDAEGGKCPFQAHIRRANPRTQGAEKPMVPRIMRRGMSYGPRHDKAHPDTGDRGLMFMAYNASIAEQFEVIQRWLSGGNSSGALSAHSDPFLGVPQPGEPRTFMFSHEGATRRVTLDNADARPFVQVQWGAYLFVPSPSALALLRDRATTAPSPAVPWLVATGAAQIKALRAAEDAGIAQMDQAWKAVLEDISSRVSGLSASVWAAIREQHGGVLRTPFGVLVADKALAMAVFENAHSRYSVKGYAERMKLSFGLIYLGLDEGCDYSDQADAVNRALMAVDEEEAFNLATEHTQAFLRRATEAAKQQATRAGLPAWEVTLDMKDLSDAVLAGLCLHWFGVPAPGGPVANGGWHWDWQPGMPPRCPGHFAAPVRYFFQPRPGKAAAEYGQTHGKALEEAFGQLVRQQREAGTPPTGKLAQALFAAFPNTPDGNTLLTRSFIGVLMGFLPTVDGNLRASLHEWINDRSLWDLQRACLASTQATPRQRALEVLKTPLMRTMQLRPVPEMVWRTATQAHLLGEGTNAVKVVPGDVIAVGIVSASQQDLGASRHAGCPVDVHAVFGGDRSAATHHTHACPAQHMAMGALLGIFSSIVESGTLRPTPAPLTLSWGGPLPAPATPAT